MICTKNIENCDLCSSVFSALNIQFNRFLQNYKPLLLIWSIFCKLWKVWFPTALATGKRSPNENGFRHETRFLAMVSIIPTAVTLVAFSRNADWTLACVTFRMVEVRDWFPFRNRVILNARNFITGGTG